MASRKLGIRVLGIDGVLGYDAIGLTIREYIDVLIGKKSDRLVYSRSFSCNSSYFDLKKGDIVIVQDPTSVSLAIVDDLYEDIDSSELSPTREIIAKVDLSSLVYSRRFTMEREELYKEIVNKLSNSDKSMLAVVDGKLIATSTDISDEIKSLIEKYNRDFPYEKAYVGLAKVGKSSVNSLYDPAYVGRSRVGRSIVDILKI